LLGQDDGEKKKSQEAAYFLFVEPVICRWTVDRGWSIAGSE
jgi:hypothetical protein